MIILLTILFVVSSLLAYTNIAISSNDGAVKEEVAVAKSLIYLILATMALLSIISLTNPNGL